MTPYSTVTRGSYVGFGAGASSKADGAFTLNTFSSFSITYIDDGWKQCMAEPCPQRVVLR